MKKSELKEIIREVIEEARSHGGKWVKPQTGKYGHYEDGHRTNTTYGGKDLLKHREEMQNVERDIDSNPNNSYKLTNKGKNDNLKNRIQHSKKYGEHFKTNTKYDSSGHKRSFKPKSSFKKSGVGR